MNDYEDLVETKKQKVKKEINERIKELEIKQENLIKKIKLYLPLNIKQ